MAHATIAGPAPQVRPKKLRNWQHRAVAAAWDRFKANEPSVLLEGCPGAGKTIPGLRFAAELIDAGHIDQILCLVPTTNLADQWADNAAPEGLNIDPRWAIGRLGQGVHGISLTYQAMACSADLLRGFCALGPTLVIADEPHHMSSERAWGTAYRHGTEPARFSVLLSGTPFRSDQTAIPGIVYDERGVAVPDVRYSYAEAVRDGVCRPIVFSQRDGELRWADGNRVFAASFADPVPERQQSRRLRTAISPSLKDGVGAMLADADAQLSELRRDSQSDAAGLILAEAIGPARQIAAMMEGICGEPVPVACSDDPRASEIIDRFRDGRGRWIVSVKMISEGVDIPRLRVGVWATNQRTAMFFRQAVGRFVRTRPGDGNDPSVLFLPADPVLMEHAATITAEVGLPLADGAADTGAAASHGDRDDADAEQQLSSFVPLSAQLTETGAILDGDLYASAKIAQAMAVISKLPEARSIAEQLTEAISRHARTSVDRNLPEHRRRDQLRKERQRLVGKLQHRSGQPFDEIARAANEHAASGASVEVQTAEQLEAGISWLLSELQQIRRS